METAEGNAEIAAIDVTMTGATMTGIGVKVLVATDGTDRTVRTAGREVTAAGTRARGRTVVRRDVTGKDAGPEEKLGEIEI